MTLYFTLQDSRLLLSAISSISKNKLQLLVTAQLNGILNPLKCMHSSKCCYFFGRDAESISCLLMLSALCFPIQDHESVIKAIYTGSEFMDSVAAGSLVGVILESTSFYAEQGGQVLQNLWFIFPVILNIRNLLLFDRIIAEKCEL